MNVFDKINLYILSIFPVYIIIIISKIKFSFFKAGSYLNESTADFFVYLREKDCIIYPMLNWIFTDQNIIIGLMLILLFWSLIVAIHFKKHIESEQKFTGEIIKISNNNVEFMSFMATYLIPLFTFNMDGIRSSLIFLVTFSLMGFLYVKADIHYSNIGLILLNFNIYSVTLSVKSQSRDDEFNTFNTILIAKRTDQEFEKNQKIEFSYLNSKNNDVTVFKSIINRGAK